MAKDRSEEHLPEHLKLGTCPGCGLVHAYPWRIGTDERSFLQACVTALGAEVRRLAARHP